MAKMEADSVVDLARLVGYADEWKGIPIPPGKSSPLDFGPIDPATCSC